MAVVATDTSIYIVRGTTPIIRCMFPTEVELKTPINVWFTISQNGVAFVNKELLDGSITIATSQDSESLEIRLTQEDTLKLSANSRAQASIRILLDDRTAVANYPLIDVIVGDVIKGGKIGDMFGPFPFDILMRPVTGVSSGTNAFSIKLAPGYTELTSTIIASLQEYIDQYYDTKIEIGQPLYKANLISHLMENQLVTNASIIMPSSDIISQLDSIFVKPVSPRPLFGQLTDASGYPYPTPIGSEQYLNTAKFTAGVQDANIRSSTTSPYTWDIFINTGYDTPQTSKDAIITSVQARLDAISVNTAKAIHATYIAPSVQVRIKPLTNYSLDQMQITWQTSIRDFINAFHVGRSLYLADLYHCVMNLEGVANCVVDYPLEDTVYDQNQQVATNIPTINLLEDASEWPLLLNGEQTRALTIANRYQGVRSATIMPDARGANTVDVIVDADDPTINALQQYFNEMGRL